MAARDSWATQAAGPTGTLDVEDARVALGALWLPGSSAVNVKSGFRPGGGLTNPGQVTASGTPDALVHVAPFQLVLQTSRAPVGGPYIITLDAQFDVNVLSTPADPTNPRNDLIIAQQSDTFYGDGVSTWNIIPVVGTPSGSPTDPAVPGSTDYVPLARVRVNANATTITNANITDLRTSGHAKSLTGGVATVAAGGILPTASQAERDALAKYNGMVVSRLDRTAWLELYDGVWQALSTPTVTSIADLANITNPYDGMRVVNTGVGPGGSGTTGLVYQYKASASAWRIPFYRDSGLLGSSSPTFTFSGIPATLRHLKVSWTARSDFNAVNTTAGLRINGDGGNNYRWSLLNGFGTSTPTASTFVGVSSAQVAILPALTAAAGDWGAGSLELHGWDNPHPGGWLTGTAQFGYIDNAVGSSSNGLYTVQYTGAGPFTSLVLLTNGNFIAGSEFNLVGWE